MIGQLKLRGRILLGYAVPLPLLIVLGGMILTNTNHVRQLIDNFNASRQGLEFTDAMESKISAMERATRGYLITQQQTHLDGFHENYQAFVESSNDTEKLLNGPQKSAFDAKQIKLAEELEAVGEKLKLVDTQIIDLVKSGKRQEALKIFAADESTQLARQAAQLNNSFNDLAIQRLHQEEQGINVALNLLASVAIAGTLVSSAAAIAIGFLLASRTSKNIRDTIQIIAASSTEIAVATEQHERVANHQATAANQTTVTMEELETASRQSTQQAEGAADSARQVLNLASIGTQAVDHTLDDMAALKFRVEVIAEQILRLSEQASQISSVSSIVSDLANQTNMLALNAAVEAARAGENGKGFAVVASEIRKLAEQSRNSGEKIKTLVSDIQHAIDSTVIATEEGTKTVEQGVKTVQGTATTFANVASAIEEIVANSQRISLTTKQQEIAIQQVVEAMNSINQGAVQTAGGISQTKAGTQKLNEAAKKLELTV